MNLKVREMGSDVPSHDKAFVLFVSLHGEYYNVDPKLQYWGTH